MLAQTASGVIDAAAQLWDPAASPVSLMAYRILAVAERLWRLAG